MRVLVIAALLVPLSAAVSSLRCVNDCIAEKDLSLIESTLRAWDRHPQQQPPNVTLEQVCKLTAKSVQCLEKCEASDQQAYFLGVTDKWQQLLCNTTEEDLHEDLGLFRYAADCHSQTEAQIGVVVALFTKAGNPTYSEADNLCGVASGIARASIRKGCGFEADLLAVEFIEYAYRLVALKLGMEDLPEKCRHFEHAMSSPATVGDLVGEFNGRGEKEISEKDHSTICMQGCLRGQTVDFLFALGDNADPCRAFKPILKCFRGCPLNKLAGVAVEVDEFLCNPHAKEYVKSQIRVCADKHAELPDGLHQTLAIAKKILSAGANAKASAADNLCQVFRAVADPSVQPFKAAAAKLNGTEAQESCQVAYDAVSTVFSLPLRVAALKLGISQEDISCGDY